MTIGINAAAAIKQPRTGVEEYTYQLIKHLTMLPEAKGHRFFLYMPSFLKEGGGGFKNNLTPTLSFKRRGRNPSPPPFKKGGENPFDFPLPPNFEIKILRWPLPFLWTQVRLAWEMLWRKPDALFIPVHVLPIFAPKNSVVTIHGLEYEYFPEYYPFWHRLYLRWNTAAALKRCRRVIAVSESTMRDLIKFYGKGGDKIEVVYHGVKNYNPSQPPLKLRGGEIPPLKLRGGEGELCKQPYILYLGRIETIKNVQGILEAYKILKEKYNMSYELVLAGAPGYGYKKIVKEIISFNKICHVEYRNKFDTSFISASHGIPKQDCPAETPKPPQWRGKQVRGDIYGVRDDKTKNDGNIIELGYVDEETKWRLLSDADIFLFPSFYEGFGLPVLEAQASGTPVVTSANSSLPEVAGAGALFVNPGNPEQIAEAVERIIDDNHLRDKLKQSGLENVKRFGWEKCARETLKILTDNL